MENCQKTKLFCKIWLWKRLKKAVIFSEKIHFFSKKLGKIQKNSKNSKKIKNEPGVMYCLIYIFFRFYFWRFDFQKNIFPIIGKFWKGPWESGPPHVGVYREKFNIDFLKYLPPTHNTFKMFIKCVYFKSFTNILQIFFKCIANFSNFVTEINSFTPLLPSQR